MLQACSLCGRAAAAAAGSSAASSSSNRSSDRASRQAEVQQRQQAPQQQVRHKQQQQLAAAGGCWAACLLPLGPLPARWLALQTLSRAQPQRQPLQQRAPPAPPPSSCRFQTHLLQPLWPPRRLAHRPARP
jgi:hypothetical protein